MKKVYKYVAPESAKTETPDESGIKDSMVDFDWDRDIEQEVRRLCNVLNAFSVVLIHFLGIVH